MADARTFETDLRRRRDALGWSQEELARRAGLSRAGVGAIETGRLVPSAAAALALAEALQCRVEDLFRLVPTAAQEARWAWAPRCEPCRYWSAEVNGSLRHYPAETTPLGVLPHDGVFQAGRFPSRGDLDPRRTLVVATCDPAVGLLAAELARTSGIRLIALSRSSRAALALLSQGVVHVAGVHLAEAGAPGGNVAIVGRQLGRQ
jgi:DNA-binding XRE family transcriptional regulator